MTSDVQLQMGDTLPMLDITAGTIHLWLAYYDEISDQRVHAAYRAILSEEERQQEPRFYFAKDRVRYLVTRALVRTVLSRYAAVTPSDWIFTADAYGRPHIANVAVQATGLSFNISHTHSLIVLGVTRNLALGVDVENIRARRVSTDIADRYFSPIEVAALAGIPVERQQDRFFEYWTFKESYIKARGMGLSIPLDQFAFQFPNERSVQLSVQPELRDNAARWRFWQFQPTPEYLVAICSERAEASPQTVVARTVVPLVSERALSVTFLRNSTP